MKLLKQATEQYNLDNTKSIMYNSVHFPLGFTLFLEALEINHLVLATYVSESSSFGFRWCDTRKDGGIMIETSQHPMTNNNSTECIVIEGSEQSLDIVKKLMTRHQVKATPLKEIIIVPDMDEPRLDFSKLDTSTEKHVFDIQNNPVYQYTSADDVILILKVNNENAAYISYNKMTLHGYTYLHILRAYTEPKFRGKAYALSMLERLRRGTNIKMLSDEHMTHAGKNMWLKLRQRFPIKVIHFMSGKIYNFDEIPLDQIFVDDKEDNEYLLIIEQLSYMQNLVVEQRGPDDGIVTSYVYIFLEQDEVLKNV